MNNKKYISVEDAIKTTWMILDGLGYAFDENPQLKKTVSAVFDTAPTADVRPVKRGRWIDRDDDYYGWNMWACSACGEEFVLTEGTPDMNEYHYCPNCGADMREKS